MDIFIGIAVLAVVAFFSYGYYVKKYVNASMVKVPTGSVAWDGETVYPPGSVHLPYQYQIISTDERVTAFGVDVLGLVSVIDTDSSESLYASESGLNEKGSFSKSTGSTRSGNSTVTTRQPTEFKHRYIITWRPDVRRIRQFVKAGDIPARIAELLRTIPDLNLYDYSELLGIEVLKFHTPKKRAASGGVDMGDGVEIPY